MLAGGPVRPRGHSVLDTWFPRPLSAVPAGSSGSRSPWQGCPCCLEGPLVPSDPAAAQGAVRKQALEPPNPGLRLCFAGETAPHFKPSHTPGWGALGDKPPDLPPTSPGAAGPGSAWGADRGGAGVGSILERQHPWVCSERCRETPLAPPAHRLLLSAKPAPAC